VAEPRDDPVEVLSGTAPGGLRWVVVVSGDDEDLYTMLQVYRDDQKVVAGSGFGGPRLPSDSVMNEWRGQTDDLPCFVMARTRPDVDRVVATTDRGSEVVLALSPPVEQFGLRFAAAALPDGERPGSLRAEREGAVLQTSPQPMRRRLCGWWRGPGVAAQRVIGGHLDQHDPGAVRVLDPHLGQPPGLGQRLPGDADPGRCQPAVLGVHVPHLKPDHDRPSRGPVGAPGHFQQPRSEKEHQARIGRGSELAVDGQAQHVAVEAAAPVGVGGAQQDPAAQYLHVSILAAGRGGRQSTLPMPGREMGGTVVNVVITGGAGFLGSRLARGLLAAGSLEVAGESARPLSRITLVDQAPAPADLAADGRVTGICGDLAALLEPGQAGREALAAADVIFHLAAAVSAECEADFDLGLRANLSATESLLALGRALGTNPVVVFSSSAAVFGTSPDHPLPAVVDDQTLPNPQTSYGTQKFMCEQLLADYTRKGFLRGRAVRLPTVSVRPGRPNAAASGFMSGIIREPLAGQRANCPVPPQTEVVLTSPTRAVSGLLTAAMATDQAWGGRTAVNLPALGLSVADMAAALERVAGPEVSALIDWEPDPEVTRIVTGWPARIRADRAARLGLTPDPDFDSIIRMHIAESG
jgi:D-erythronate 2-dehydrogenase